jgi:hypothetical protein
MHAVTLIQTHDTHNAHAPGAIPDAHRWIDDFDVIRVYDKMAVLPPRVSFMPHSIEQGQYAQQQHKPNHHYNHSNEVILCVYVCVFL